MFYSFSFLNLKKIMQFETRIRGRRLKLKYNEDVDLYPYAIQFYRRPPVGKISLEEFEKLALERLQVLRILEHVGTKHSRNSQEYKDILSNELRKKNLYFYLKTTNDEMDDEIYSERRRDHVSHFILRLAYCKNEALRRWFVSQEVDLFRMRFINEKSKHKKLFMDSNKLDYQPLEEKEKKALLPKLISANTHGPKMVHESAVYKVPFTEVLDLVSSRRVYLRFGMAYIYENDFVSIVVSAFRSHLSHSLAIASRALPTLEEDGRLMRILGNINQRYLGADFGKTPQFTGEVSPEMLDELSKSSFPLCMRTLHERLRSAHHLKHFGRLQYGLFLKGIGLSLEDALRFWRSEFTKVMDIDKFDKAYAYSIRFNYGKEGKRANYTPYNCMKIITTNAPGPGEFHGCPFKQWDTANLQRKLAELKISNSAISEVLDLSKKNHYQLACTKCFEATHNETSLGQAIQHPNQYFIESQSIYKGTEPRKGLKSSSQVNTTRAVMYGNNKMPAKVPESNPSNSAAMSSHSLDDDALNDFDMEDIEDLMKGVE